MQHVNVREDVNWSILITGNELKLLFNLFGRLNPKNNVVILSKENQEEICNALDIKKSMLRKLLKGLKDADVIQKIRVNQYMINPFYIHKTSMKRLPQFIEEYEKLDGNDDFVNNLDFEYVYLIHAIDTNRYKIGRSLDVDQRLLTLRQQCPYQLELVAQKSVIDSKKEESRLHKLFHQYRVHGEWFEIDDKEIIETIKNCFC